MPEQAIYIGIGSNVEPQRHVPAALAALGAAYGPLAISPLYRCAPVGLDGPDFINAVVRGSTLETPEALRDRLKELEREAGRDHGEKLAVRELDLDLLLYGAETVRLDGLRIPRPDILAYSFVLRPLADIAPEVIHPETGHDFAWHWAHFEGERIPLHPVELDGCGMASRKEAENGRGDRI
ncbi:MAG: 2-amino-4-hydroxy-6-hydroxymethyldihydropteridine diphosphokinase [Gammaproteobacteria bacterium]|nr:2-amino-4-hydroxy-6-hydroxymethyldihydropteridine diphosphokinase [Gammaproteobacteria bacterium]